MKLFGLSVLACMTAWTVDLHALDIGVKLTHNLGATSFRYDDMTDLPGFKKLKPGSGLLHSFGVGACLDTNPGGNHWFGYRFTAEAAYGNTPPDNSLPLARIHFINMPHFKLYRNDIVKLWAGPMIAFGGIIGSSSKKSYILVLPNFFNSNNAFVYPFKMDIKSFYFNAGGAMGVNINLENAYSLTVEAGARIGLSSSTQKRVPYSAGSIRGYFSVIEGYVSFGCLYRVIDRGPERPDLELDIILK